MKSYWHWKTIQRNSSKEQAKLHNSLVLCTSNPVKNANNARETKNKPKSSPAAHIVHLFSCSNGCCFVSKKNQSMRFEEQHFCAYDVQKFLSF